MHRTRRILLAALALGARAAPERPLRVGANLWPGYEPLYIARSLGYLDASSIELIDFATAAEVVRAWHNGLIDVAALTGDEALLANEGNDPGRVVLVCDYSKGADAVLGRPPVATMTDLDGKRIAVEPLAVGTYMLARALERAGMTPDQVTTVPLGQSEQVQAMQSGAVHGVVTFDPNRATLLAEGATLLFDSSRIPGEIIDVLLARRALSSRHERELQRVVDAWFRALGYIAANPADAAARAAPREGLTASQLQEALQRVTFVDLATNRRLLAAGGDNLHTQLKKLGEAMATYRLIRAVPPPPPLDDRYVRAVAR